MSIILGIDPGSRCTGYGLVYNKRSQQQCIAHGHIAAKKNTVGERLEEIYQGLCNIIEEFNPSEISIEKIFTHRNPASALKLGQARGVALLACAKYVLPVMEYSPREIKLAVVGYGAASKDQVQYMVKTLLSLKNEPQTDAADALAIALCHCQARKLLLAQQ